MDIELEQKIGEAIEYIKSLAEDQLELQLMDPVCKMMLVALLHESQKIQDSIDNIGQKLVDRYCEDFIPRKEIDAMPAIALVAPRVRANKNTDFAAVSSSVSFVAKNVVSKASFNYIPLFSNNLLPYEDIYVITPHRMRSKAKNMEIQMEKENIMWVGINTETEVESLLDFSFFIHNIPYVSPKRISVISNDICDLSFATMNEMEDIDMLEPFDAQQASGKLFSILNHWKEYLLELPQGSLFYINDNLKDRDVFKRKAFPRFFQNWLESEALDCFSDNTLWLQIEYPDGLVIPDDCYVTINTFPIVNIDVNTVTLTQAAPIAKLQKTDGSFFIQVLETSNASHKQGFGMNSEDFVIRDFDASCYHNGDLYRDVRNMYNHFVEDYYAFIEYNGLKDGIDIKRLKELINKIGKSVGSQNSKYSFDSGTYVMKNINQAASTLSTKVSFMTTQGDAGNVLQMASVSEKEIHFECKKMPLIEPVVPIVVGAVGGKDKASADTRYEQIRYYALTRDRLYTKMDVDAFVRKELITLFGKEEFKRITIKVYVEGAGGAKSLERGLYVDIEFKDKKNYNKAIVCCLKEYLIQKINNKSCIAMPIVVGLKSLE